MVAITNGSVHENLSKRVLPRGCVGRKKEKGEKKEKVFLGCRKPETGEEGRRETFPSCRGRALTRLERGEEEKTLPSSERKPTEKHDSRAARFR